MNRFLYNFKLKIDTFISLFFLPFIFNKFFLFSLESSFFGFSLSYFLGLLLVVLIFFCLEFILKFLNNIFKIVFYSVLWILIYSLPFLKLVMEFFSICYFRAFLFLCFFSFIFFRLFYLFLEKQFKFFALFTLIYICFNFFNYRYLFEANYFTRIKFPDVILVVVDEFSSPLVLNKKFKDHTIMDFSNNLKSKGWKVNDYIFSNNLLTTKSVASLLNFSVNISDNEGDFSTLNKIRYSKFSKLLKGKFYNFSFFESNGDLPQKNVFYNFSNNPFFFLVEGTLFDSFFSRYSVPVESYNRFILSQNFDFGHNYFAYIHLLMPHKPFFYGNEINTKNYLEYWKFSTFKIQSLLDSIISKNKKAKIILIGDHGYRSDLEINSNYTFLAYYGFETKFVPKSVQEALLLVVE